MAERASEEELVLLARGLVAPSPGLGELLHRERERPRTVSPEAAALVGDALAQVWPALWRRGGVAPATGIDGKRGRPWERHAPAQLTFTPSTLVLLHWLLTAPLTARTVPALDGAPRSLGDQVIVYLALAAADGTPAQAAIAAQPYARAAPLAWLGFAHAMTGPVPPFAPLCAGAGAIVVEVLGPELARRWRAAEHARAALSDPAAVIAFGAAQDDTLRGFLAACDLAHRRDLAGFVLDAAAEVLAREPVALALDPTAPLGRRSEARLAAGALLRGVMTWAGWDEAHRAVRFFDDDYAAAQVLLARFEAIGPAGVARAAARLTDLASLAPTTAATVGIP